MRGRENGWDEAEHCQRSGLGRLGDSGEGQGIDQLLEGGAELEARYLPGSITVQHLPTAPTDPFVPESNPNGAPPVDVVAKGVCCHQANSEVIEPAL